MSKGVKIVLSQYTIKEAIKEYWCPFCKDKGRRFTVRSAAWQELSFDEVEDDGKRKFEKDFGDIETDSLYADDVVCWHCDKPVPKEVSGAWLKDE